jgi:dihydroorotate dehydrogenase
MGFGIDEEAERIVLDGEAGVPPGSLIPGRLMAVQITKNKNTSENDIEAVKRDYSFCVQQLGKYADILVVNVSSPNTPGLRALQNVEPLTHLLKGVVKTVKQVDRKTKPVIMVKVSPDEDSEEQVSGICEAVWASGVDGVIVGNTTMKRPDPLPKGYLLPKSEANVLLEQGGYSGPQMFERTLALVKRYRKTLDHGPKQIEEPLSEKAVAAHSTPDDPASSVLEKLESANTKTGDLPSSAAFSLPNASTQVPKDSDQLSSNVDDLSESAPSLSFQSSPSSVNVAPAPKALGPRKVIFATGGITNGTQAREILGAGASVAMVYTALIYGGVGTISRIKEEMRDDAKAEERH